MKYLAKFIQNIQIKDVLCLTLFNNISLFTVIEFDFIPPDVSLLILSCSEMIFKLINCIYV